VRNERLRAFGRVAVVHAGHDADEQLAREP